MRPFQWVACLVWAAAPVSAAAAKPVPDLVILPLDVNRTASQADSPGIEAAVYAAVTRTRPGRIIEDRRVRAVLQSTGLEAECDSSACWTALAGKLGAKEVLSIHVARVGHEWLVVARRFAVPSGELLGRSADFHRGGAKSLGVAVPKLAAELAASSAGVAEPHQCRYGKSQSCDAQCTAGDSGSCFVLAQMYDTTGNDKRAAKLLLRACDGGHAAACTEAGDLAGRGILQESRHAADFYETGCQAGAPESCYALGELQRRASGSQSDQALALASYRRACEELGAVVGCVELGAAYRDGRGVAADPERAAALFRRACSGGLDDQGNSDGCSMLGWMYSRGLGVPSNPTQAADLFRRGCEHEDAWACDELVGLLRPRCDAGEAAACTGVGKAYWYGWGTTDRDIFRAADLLTQGCERGDPEGCTAVGRMHETGDGGFDKDIQRAMAMYEQACSHSEPEGCLYLGRLLLERAVGPARSRGVAMYRKACDRGQLDACFLLGQSLENGDGASRNQAAALELYRRACHGPGGGVGSTAACDRLDALAKGH